MDAVHDERRLLDAPQIREAIAAEVLPIAKGGDLCGGHFRARRWIPISSTFG
jgi:hypothetical protein